jgi:hypothetical protein
MAKAKCPKCAVEFVRRVSRIGLAEKFLSLFYIYPFKCQLCGCRFRSIQWGVRYTRIEEDRRMYDRLAVRCPVTFSAGQGFGEGTLVDLSMGGCGLSTDAKISVGEILEMRLKVWSDAAPIVVEAAVVRHVQSKAVGIEFLQWSPSERERMQQFVRSLLIDRLKLSAYPVSWNPMILPGIEKKIGPSS